MITKNEFYGQYLINVANDKEAADYDISVLSEEVERAWKVIEQLQHSTEDSPLFKPGSGIIYTTNPPKLKPDDAASLEFAVDDAAEEPKAGKLSFFTDEQNAEIKAIVNDGEVK